MTDDGQRESTAAVASLGKRKSRRTEIRRRESVVVRRDEIAGESDDGIIMMSINRLMLELFLLQQNVLGTGTKSRLSFLLLLVSMQCDAVRCFAYLIRMSFVAIHLSTAVLCLICTAIRPIVELRPNGNGRHSSTSDTHISIYDTHTRAEGLQSVVKPSEPSKFHIVTI